MNERVDGFIFEINKRLELEGPEVALSYALEMLGVFADEITEDAYEQGVLDGTDEAY